MRLKSVIQVFVLVISMALIAVYVFLHFQDYSRIKGLIEQAVMDASGRRLVVHGDLVLALSLTPQLQAKNICLANASWDQRRRC